MRFQFRYALLTYAQCGDLDPFAVVYHLADLGFECIIGREDHSDGGTHLHAFIDHGTYFRRSGTHLFDVEGHHPNVQPCRRTPEQMWDYATKDGDIVAGGLERPSGGGLPATGDVWAQLVDVEDRDEFFSLAQQLCPRNLLCSFTSFRAYADWRFAPEPEQYESPPGLVFDTSVAPELDEWVRDHLEGHRPGVRGKSLVLIGPSRLGKTLWARSLCREHAYFGGMYSADISVEDVKYAVFDDMLGGLEFFHSYKFWLGQQATFTMTDKYRAKKVIKWGRPAIYLANSDPRCDKGADMDWLDANCTFVFLKYPLF